MGQAQINVRTRACSRTSIARTKQAALTHNVRGKELKCDIGKFGKNHSGNTNQFFHFHSYLFFYGECMGAIQVLRNAFLP